MKQLTKNDCAEFLRSHDNFCILTHRKPDGDTLGCAAALCRGLRSMGKMAHVLRNAETTARYEFLQDGLTCPEWEEGMTVVSVDIAAKHLIPASAAEAAERVELKIDHHGTGDDFAPRGLVDPGSAACGEIIWEILEALGVSPDRPMAEAVYTAISTDTGCFRFSNTTARTLRTAAACIDAGAEIYPINQALFEQVRLQRLRFNAYCAQHLELLAGGRIALLLIPREAELACGVTEDDLDGLSNFARNIEGVCLSVTFRDEPGATKLSVRSVPGWDSAKLCAAFGGGGHAAAAGARVASDRESARRQVLEVLETLGYLR